MYILFILIIELSRDPRKNHKHHGSEQSCSWRQQEVDGPRFSTACVQQVNFTPQL